MTPLFAITQKKIKDDFHLLFIHQLEPWMFLNSGKPITVKRHDGKQISYKGCGFAGSPQTVFWRNYIEPFIEEIAVKQINDAIELSKVKNIDGVEVLQEVELLLHGEITSVFNKMASIEQRLLGKGFPDTVRLRNVKPKIADSMGFVARILQSEIQMYSTKPWYQQWYEKNSFMIWVAGALFTLVGLYAKYN